jgi:hypothetical protein
MLLTKQRLILTFYLKGTPIMQQLSFQQKQRLSLFQNKMKSVRTKSEYMHRKQKAELSKENLQVPQGHPSLC